MDGGAAQTRFGRLSDCESALRASLVFYTTSRAHMPLKLRTPIDFLKEKRGAR
jgi:hypothetical protein